MPRIDEEVRAKIPEAFARLGTVRAVARELGLSRWAVEREVAAPTATRGSGPEPEGRKFSEAGDEATLDYGTAESVRTLEDAIRIGRVDTSVWAVASWELTSWEVGMKVRSFDQAGKVNAEEPITRPLWRVKLRLRRIMPRPFLDAAEALFARLESRAPDFAPIRRARTSSPHLLEVDLFDVHFGKLAWGRETGADYDLKIAERVFRDAVEDIVESASGFDVERVVLPIGNDFFHVDGLESSTTAGTRVDSDGRYYKIIEAGEFAALWAVEYLLGVAPVTVLWVPGNHDRVASLHLCRALKAYFRKCRDVQVDVTPPTRKYLRYGANLIGFAHGDEARPERLPNIMAVERPVDWGQARHREWHVGHRHKAKEVRTTPVDTFDGVVVRTIRSLSGTDYWHYAQGYVGGQRAAEGFLWRPEGGLVANLVAHLRDPGPTPAASLNLAS